MNDFHATLVDWKAFRGQFDETGIGRQLQAAMEARDHNGASALADEFLCLWMWPEGGDGEYPVTLGFKRLAWMASLYGENCGRLNIEVRAGLEGLYFPFVGHWMELEPGERMELMPPDMKFLECGGLTLAISPEDCCSIVVGLEGVAWEDLLAKAMDGRQQEDKLLMMEETKRLFELVSHAVKKQQGLLVVFEI